MEQCLDINEKEVKQSRAFSLWVEDSKIKKITSKGKSQG